MNRNEARERAVALVEKMTMEERASQLIYNARAIERLNIKSYNWWNEALHGVARAGTATVFPQAIGMAASFNTRLMGEVASAISDEARAKYNMAMESDDTGQYKGLTFWSPNINIFRDPRWGRGHETYGEDPFLTTAMGKVFVENMQGDGEFLKTAACAKHYAAHSGPESIRHGFDSVVDDHDLFDTYLVAFERVIKDTDVEAVMGAYNSVNGEPCCASKRLLNDILRERWGFKGHVVSDCWAINDIHLHHKLTSNALESSSMAIKNGCDLNCGEAYASIMAAYVRGMITDEEITTSAVRLMTTRVLLGEFEKERPFSDISYDVVDCKKHRDLNYKMACESLVLLKNKDKLLPLDCDEIKSIAVIGPNALSVPALEGNYSGVASQYITVADGIRNAFPTARIYYSEGSHLFREAVESFNEKNDRISEAVAAARAAQVTVLCVGLDSLIEGEQGGDQGNMNDGGDKADLYLPVPQRVLVEKVCESTDNVIVVLLSGSSLDINPHGEKAKAVIQAWYPGAVGGQAVADLIAGKFSPSGRLPVTFHKGTDSIPPFEDYSMDGRTYRYIKEKPMYPFGFGLSYSDFEYSNLIVNKQDDFVRVMVDVRNKGDISAAEVTQVYALFDEQFKTPNFSLCGFEKTFLKQGETKALRIDIPVFWLMPVNEKGERVMPKKPITLFVGSNQPDERSNKLFAHKCISERVSL